MVAIDEGEGGINKSTKHNLKFYIWELHSDTRTIAGLDIIRYL